LLFDQNGLATEPMNQLESKFEKFIMHHQLVGRRQSVLLAVSGGIDSMVMVHLFSKIRKKRNLRLSIGHINHQLRGEESKEDERFVRDISAVYKFPYYCERVNVASVAREKGLSKQTAARRLRYECLERIRRRVRASVVATAHHANDNAETVLFNILRGTGLHGLSGIPLNRDAGNIIRPLLFATKMEIVDYASEHNIKYRDDSSNTSLKYYRNYLRIKILPSLKKNAPDIVKSLNTISDKMRDVNKKLRMIISRKLKALIRQNPRGDIFLDIRGFLSEPEFLQDEIFLELLNRMQIEPSMKKIIALRNLSTLSIGKELKLGGICSAYRDREHIVFTEVDNSKPDVQLVEPGGKYNYKGGYVSIGRPQRIPASYSKTPTIEYVDAELLGRRLVLRPWHSGDWFIPLGMQQKKKISDFFTDQKVSKYLKTSIPILESDGKIVWICGRRLDDRFKLTEHSRTAIRLSYQSTI
jgi:tRNA(Ile)-lysidine synthase